MDGIYNVARIYLDVAVTMPLQFKATGPEL